MKIHEYQAKDLFKQHGINVPSSIICEHKENIDTIIENFSVPCVIKAQVHSGARGKAGGVKVAKSMEEAKKYAKEILGMELKSSQAGVKKVNKILIEEAVDIDKELYLSLTFDRVNEAVSLIMSSQGGMDIEEVAEKDPSAILTQNIDINETFSAKSFVAKFDYGENISKQLVEVIESLYKLYIEKDASLVEINPLVITRNQEVIAIDAKMTFDDNALYRQQDILSMKDEKEENPLELEAQKFDLNYIKLDGTIGCMVNGAGLAMATMDVIKLAGKNAANFLDVGGGASSDKIEKAFKILVSDENVKAVFINIFGGILRCDILAEGLTNAAKNLNIKLPLIVRLEGTNKEAGAKILKDSGLEFSVVNDLSEAIEIIKGL